MKINTKELKDIFAKAKKENQYVTEENFLDACQDFAKTFAKYNTKKSKTIFCSIKVSASGVSRKINFEGQINMVVNTILASKVSYDPYRADGCGMDMLWYTLFRTIGTIQPHLKDSYNGTCSHITSIL